MQKKDTLMTFPCDFPIKIIGKNTPSFQQDIVDITLKHYPDTPSEHIKKKYSKHHGYCSFEVIVKALSQETLNDFYQALTKHPDVRMVL